MITSDAKIKADILKSNILINKKARDFGFFLFCKEFINKQNSLFE